jgi:single-stranded DNA-binding protein
MAKIRLIGKVVTDVVAGTIGQNNTKYIKYLVEVAIGVQTSNNPRMAQNSNDIKKSYFAIMAFGKQAEFPIAKGITVELDGKLEISKFQLNQSFPEKDAAIVTPEYTTILQGNIQHIAKAYNVLGNLVQNDADVYTAQNGGNNVFSQKIAIGKKVNEQEFTSFFRIKLFGERGEKLFAKQMLNKAKVKSILVDGSITATYTKKEKNGDTKEYFNVDININDFQIGSWASKENSTTQGGSTNSAYQAYANVDTNNEPPIDYYDHEDEDENEIPF